MYKAHSCTTQFQPDIREGSPGENSASEDVDAFVRTFGGVENGGSSGEAALRVMPKGDPGLRTRGEAGPGAGEGDF